MSDDKKRNLIGVRILWFALGMIFCVVCILAGYLISMYVQSDREGSILFPDYEFLSSSSLEEIIDRYGMPRVIYYGEDRETTMQGMPMFVYGYKTLTWREWQEEHLESGQQVYAVGYYHYPDDGEKHDVIVIILDEDEQAVEVSTDAVKRADEM